MKRRLVVVGGVAAGMSAASRAKRMDPGLDVVVLQRGPHISYGACSLPYFVADHFDDYRKLIARTPEEAAKRGVDVRIYHEVDTIDVDRQLVTATDTSPSTGGRQVEFPYDKLVLATGTVPVVPPAWGAENLEGAFLLRTIEDAQGLRETIARGGPSLKAVVIGGGYIGVEAADVLVQRGVAVTLLDMAPQLLTNFDVDIATYVEEDLRAAGVDVRLGQGVESLSSEKRDDGTRRVTGVRTAAGDVIEADFVVMALGVRPNVALAEAAGIPLGETGAIAVDEQQRTGVANVFAAGDCCQTQHLVTGHPAYIPLGTTANKQGRVAGTIIGGGEASFPGIVGTAVLKAHRVAAARTGLTETEATAAGYDAVAATITAPDRVHSYPGVQQITVKLVAEKSSGRLLGGQIVGTEPLAVSGRIDVVATALTRSMAVDEFAHLDLSYAPPFAPVWDALLVAANVLERDV